MAKRYYLCTILPPTDERDYYHAAPDVLGLNHEVTFPPRDPATGLFQGTECLVVVSARDHRALAARADVDPLPEFPLDARLSAMQGGAHAAMSAAITRRGFVQDWSGSAGFRDVVRSVGQQINPRFDERSFDVAD